MIMVNIRMYKNLQTETFRYIEIYTALLPVTKEAVWRTPEDGAYPFLRGRAPAKSRSVPISA